MTQWTVRRYMRGCVEQSFDTEQAAKEFVTTEVHEEEPNRHVLFMVTRSGLETRTREVIYEIVREAK